MKSLGKILLRYVLSATGVALTLTCVNLAVFMAFVLTSFESDPVFDRRLGELAASVQWTGEAWEAVDGSVLEGNFCWAMLLSEAGDILWSEALPDGQNRHYTVSDVASFARWYLSDYPVQVWKHEAGLFVIAQPRGSMWKQQMWMSSRSMDLLLRYTLPAFLTLNAAAALLLALAFGLRLFRSVKPVAQGISDLGERRPVALAEKGLFGELSASLNRASERLQRQELMLKKRDRTRTEWIAGVSHDIRTPLTLVLGEAAQLEGDAALGEAARGKARTIRVQGERIRALVSDLNLASKLEYELQPLRAERFRPAGLLRSTAAEVLNGGIPDAFSLEMDIPQECEGVLLEGDAPLLDRAVRNLVGNSIQHNPQGCGVTLGMRCEGTRCRIFVEDTGSGFPQDALERVRHAPEGAISSHGLGLTIVRQIARAHGGILLLENTGDGARAVIVLEAYENLKLPL